MASLCAPIVSAAIKAPFRSKTGLFRQLALLPLGHMGPAVAVDKPPAELSWLPVRERRGAVASAVGSGEEGSAGERRSSLPP